jgi:hypothetical protein
VTYLGPDCFGECNGTAPQRSVSAGPPPAPTDGSSSVFLFNGSNAEWNDLDDPASYGLSMRTCIDAATATGSYVVCTFYELATRNASGSRGPSYNTAVLINRSGRPVGKYRKMYPTDELIEGKGELNEGIIPGAAGRKRLLFCAVSLYNISNRSFAKTCSGQTHKETL